jgi:ribosomal-protein-alanine N-acetyltransferase
VSRAPGQARGIAIRPAGPNDVDAVTAIERDTFTQPWSRRSFAELVGSPPVAFLVAARDDGAVSGYAVVYFAAEECELANLAVTMAERGRGIGRRLLEACLAEATRRRAHRMFLEVRASNVAAQSLYTGAGFVPVGRRARYYQAPIEDALVLRLDLPSRMRGAGPVVGAT